MGYRRRRHRHDNAVEQLVMPLIVRTSVEELLDGQKLVGRFHLLKLASMAAQFQIHPSSSSANTSAKRARSMLPPDWMTATRLPASRLRSCRAAASAAAPAPSAVLCVSLKRMRIARRISASETVTIRAAPRRMTSSASALGTRTASPPAIVSAELVLTGAPAAKDSA